MSIKYWGHPARDSAFLILLAQYVCSGLPLLGITVAAQPTNHTRFKTPTLAPCSLFINVS